MTQADILHQCSECSIMKCGSRSGNLYKVKFLAAEDEAYASYNVWHLDIYIYRCHMMSLFTTFSTPPLLKNAPGSRFSSGISHRSASTCGRPGHQCHFGGLGGDSAASQLAANATAQQKMATLGGLIFCWGSCPQCHKRRFKCPIQFQAPAEVSTTELPKCLMSQT